MLGSTVGVTSTFLVSFSSVIEAWYPCATTVRWKVALVLGSASLDWVWADGSAGSGVFTPNQRDV